MGLLPNLIYYSSVATRDVRIIAEYVDRDKELRSIAARCLDLIPSLHSRFSYTIDRRMLCCIIEKDFIFCTISDQGLGKKRAFSFTEQVRDEFKDYVIVRGLDKAGSRLEGHSVNVEFSPILRSLAAPFVGIPQIEKDRFQGLRVQQNAEAAFPMSFPSPLISLHEDEEHPLNAENRNRCCTASTPFTARSNSSKHKKKKAGIYQNSEGNRTENKIKSSDKDHKLEIMMEGTNQLSTVSQMQRAVSMRKKAQQVPSRMRWRKVACFLIFYAIVIAILLFMWLLICKGFSCAHKNSDG